jgi:FAD/FMN-containing dehydrogenase
MAITLTGSGFHRGDSGYEDARRATVWNVRLPDRYPAVIVQARSVDDVEAAVRYAAAHGLRVGARSGGHSWAYARSSRANSAIRPGPPVSCSSTVPKR